MNRAHLGDLWHFVGHIFWASLAFVLIALIALGLQYVLDFVEANGYSRYVSISLRIVEYIVFTIDILIYLIYVIKKGIEFVRSLF